MLQVFYAFYFLSYNDFAAIPLELDQVPPPLGDPNVKVKGCVDRHNIKAWDSAGQIGVVKIMCVANSGRPVKAVPLGPTGGAVGLTMGSWCVATPSWMNPQRAASTFAHFWGLGSCASLRKGISGVR